MINPHFQSVYFDILNNVSNYIFNVSFPFMVEFFFFFFFKIRHDFCERPRLDEKYALNLEHWKIYALETF